MREREEHIHHMQVRDTFVVGLDATIKADRV